MQSDKTFTTRSNAKRNAIKAGVPAEQIEITAHGKGDDVRFGWKQTTTTVQRDTSLLADTFPAPGKKSADKKDAPAPKQARPEQNGIKMPGEGTKCRAVWEWCDSFKKDTGSAPDAPAAREHAERAGWNINNTLIETANWKRFHGLTRKKAA